MFVPRYCLGLVSCLLLTGCFQISVEEKINKDGTSIITINTDVSAMLNMAEGIAGGFSYKSCSDPKLLEKYQVESLNSPAKIIETKVITKEINCEVAADGQVKITTTQTTTSDKPNNTNDNPFASLANLGGGLTVTQSAESCSDKYLLEQYDTDQFPVTSIQEKTNITEISCEETDENVSIKSTTVDPETGKSQGSFSQSFSKPKEPTVTEGQDQCQENKGDMNLSALEVISCESPEPGVAIMTLKRENTEIMEKVGNDVVYDLQYSINPVDDKVESSNNSGTDITQMGDPEAFGMKFTYKLVSPWEITEHTAGEKIDDNTLEINLLKHPKDQPMKVTFKDAAKDIKPYKGLPIKWKMRVIDYLKEVDKKLKQSETSAEKKTKYLTLLSEKFKKWSGENKSKNMITDFAIKKINFLEEKHGTVDEN